ncbi:MAG: molybdopterin-dependent oxidoreductase [Pseudomonadota bacterium]
MAVRTTCPYCGVGCGVLASRQPDGSVQVKGDPDHPANYGRLCSKGAALGETTGLDGRLLTPMVDGVATGWDAALDHVARGFAAAIDEHGPASVAFYVSGQLLTEDYYVANKLMKGFIGAANIDTNSRLCMASAVAAHKRAFGTDTVPCDYTDLETADLVVLAGSNLAWCHPVIWQRLEAARRRRPEMRVVVIDPRRTATAELADLHLPIAPGMDGLLFAGLLAELDRRGVRDDAFVADHVDDMAAALEAAHEVAPNVASVARGCSLELADVTTLADWYARHDRTVTLWSQGLNQSTSGTDKGNAVINVHLLTGRIGRPGMGPFSITGQPNAMGGREVGGLATQLAAHVDFDDAARTEIVRRFWRAPRLATTPGLKAVDLFDAVDRGQIKALWIMATNPAASLPAADRVRDAIRKCPLVVVSDNERRTDTTELAHVLLPAAAWGEKDGTVTNSERTVSRQRGFLPVPGAARPDWWIVKEVAHRLGHGADFAYDATARIFAEHAALARAVGRDLDFGGADVDYDALEPTAWPFEAKARLFADGRFFTADERACAVPVRPRPPAQATSAAQPLVMLTGRYRDAWHTQTRTGRAPSLTGHRPEARLELHPSDAVQAGVGTGDLVRATTPWGAAVLRAEVTDRVAAGTCFAPMHWTAQQSSAGRIDALVAPHVDPVSGQPESKAQPVAITRMAAGAECFFVSTERHEPPADALYWSRRRVAGGWLVELALAEDAAEPVDLARSMLDGANIEWLEYSDPVHRRYRAVARQSGAPVFALFVNEALPRDWLAGAFGTGGIGARELLAAVAAGVGDGPLVCACFGVGEARVQAAIAAGARSVDALGAALKAGTNCGSCRPELQALLRDHIEEAA